MEKRQRFTAEFKREAVGLLKNSGKPVAMVARELGVRPLRPAAQRASMLSSSTPFRTPLFLVRTSVARRRAWAAAIERFRWIIRRS